MVDGVTGFLLRPKVRAALCPQLLTARTESVPLVKLDAALNVIVLVPCPERIVVFVAAVQL